MHRRQFLASASVDAALAALPAAARGFQLAGEDARLREMLDGFFYARIDESPEGATALGLDTGARAAMEAHQGKANGKEIEFIAGELATVKFEVTDLQRMAMVQQVATIIRTLLDQKRTPGYIAQHAVDAVLRETAR